MPRYFLFLSIFLLFTPSFGLAADRDGIPHSAKAYQLTVDCRLSLGEMVARGHYSAVDTRNITPKNFPLQCGEANGREIVVEVISFELASDKPEVSGGVVRKTTPMRTISTEDVLREMARQNLRPATIEELLTLGATYPHIHRDGPITALGSSPVVEGERRVPFIGSHPGRALLLSWLDGNWGVVFRFLAVRK